MADLDMAMPVRERDGYRQSALVLGAAQLGGSYGIANTVGMPDDDATARLLRTAAELGVTHVDTARAYGESEHRIGACRVPSLRVITKVAPLGGVADAPDAVRAAVTESVARSRAELGDDPLTLLLHRAADATSAGGAAWDTLRGYADDGVADRIGVSVQSPAELHTVLGLPGLGYVQLPCNLLDRRWRDPALTEALAARPGLVVTARSVYLQGLLAAGAAVRWPHLSDTDRDTLVGTLDLIASELGRDGRIELCLAYVLGLPWVTSVVIGAETEEQVRRNVSLAVRPPLSADERAAVVSALPDVPGALLDPSRWTS
ncbi:aldo/keto reductase [Jidongwangia harbinensis]|uniref:aldo/keto reductase n=1 Tax=Jidongwangia harbinensis TaxID=2878561 RepID=UPI001CD97E2D|nr:aldo/keto reductase [Jidongwangia harbinensis]MCA2213168.1 aldo/keto reductase [Jidongwangia harbinensis]